MSNKGIAVLTFIALIVVVLAGATWYWKHSMSMQSNMHMDTDNAAPHQNITQKPSDRHENAMPKQTEKSTHEYAKNLIKPKEGQPVKKVSLVAKESKLLIRDGLTLPVWTYNGTVPGQEIRVTQGDFVEVELRNELKDPVTIHWHGYPLLSAMDGVPGINQDSVKPEETFTYAFSADVPGTYWYHSHQEGSKQVDKGLYAALIVEPKEGLKVNKDFTLILDEWMEKPLDDMDSMEGMNMGGHGSTKTDNKDPVMAEEVMMAESYNIYTVNGKSGNLISPLEVKKGDTVRVRLINAGYRSHGIHIPGQDFKVVSTDGQDIEGPSLIRDQIILVAPGERYDVEFTVSGEEDFVIDAHDGNPFNDQMKIPVKVAGGNGKLRTHTGGGTLPFFDLTSYGTPREGKFSLHQKFDMDYKVELSTKTDKNRLQYTINGKTFNELPSLKVKTGDVIKFTFENKSKVDHPMHLHGHFFEVLSKNDTPLRGAVHTKDTLLVRPDEKYVVAFKADNTGRWVQHCHELHHAAAGMMQGIEYTDYKPNYMPDPNNKDNKPE
ncbi:MAG: multicopper oxidase family protein [Clostridia bacterium]|nr:multicopper oxidase family protein [Clostridia bacterium]